MQMTEVLSFSDCMAPWVRAWWSHSYTRATRAVTFDEHTTTARQCSASATVAALTADSKLHQRTISLPWHCCTVRTESLSLGILFWFATVDGVSKLRRK